MIDWICVDVEIQKTVEQAGGWGSTDLMGVSVAGVYEYAADRLRLYGPEDVQALRDRLLRADRISGFNNRTFDLPVIFGVARADIGAHPILQQLAPRVDDLLERIWQGLGHREKGWGVNDVARGTLGVEKVGDGAEAPLIFQRGEWARLADYCMVDVQIERDLVNFAEKYKFLLNGRGLVNIPPWQSPPRAEPVREYGSAPGFVAGGI